MTTSSLAPPPRDSARRATPPARGPLVPAPAPRARPGASYERALRWSLLLSLVAHAVLLLLPGRFMQVEVPDEASRQASQDEYSGLEWVVPVPEGAEGDSPAAGAPAAEAPREQPDPRVLRVTPGQTPPPASAPAVPSAEGGQGSTRESLRPGYRDPRLYVETDPLVATGPEKSDHQKYMEHLQARIDAVNDSMGLAAERERSARDWSFRDKEGGRWGLSDEGLHLGGFTVPRALIPAPRSTGDNATQEAAREEQRQRDEIRRQEEERERREAQDAAARATRERNEAARRQGGGG